MKKIVALLLTLLSVLMCFASCNLGNNSDTQSSSEFLSASTRVVYNNLCYYVGNIQQGELSSENTIKIQNLSNLQQDGIQLYSDPIGNDDPFRGKYTLGGHTKMLVDENATKANGGMPVLLIGLKRETIKNGENVTQKYEIMSYNTATNKVTVIAEDIEELQNFYLLNNRIYCVARKWKEQSEEPSRVFTVFSVDKSGNNKIEYTLPDDKLTPSLLGIHKGKLYFMNSSTSKIYKTDFNFENTELICEDLNHGFFLEGYVYYSANNEKLEIDSVEVTSTDYLRRPIDKIGNKESEEIIIENIYHYFLTPNNNIIYCRVDEMQTVTYGTSKTHAYSIMHAYDFKTGEESLLYDFSEGNTDKIYFIQDIFEDFFTLLTNDPSVKGLLKIDRKTGEQTIVGFNIFK